MCVHDTSGNNTIIVACPLSSRFKLKTTSIIFMCSTLFYRLNQVARATVSENTEYLFCILLKEKQKKKINDHTQTKCFMREYTWRGYYTDVRTYVCVSVMCVCSAIRSTDENTIRRTKIYTYLFTSFNQLNVNMCASFRLDIGI